MQFSRRAQNRTCRDECVAPDGHGDGTRSGGRAGGGCGGREGAGEVAADEHVGLDYGAAAQNDVLRAVDLGAARDFVAGVLDSGQCG